MPDAFHDADRDIARIHEFDNPLLNSRMPISTVIAKIGSHLVVSSGKIKS